MMMEENPVAMAMASQQTQRTIEWCAMSQDVHFMVSSPGQLFHLLPCRREGVEECADM